MRFRDYVLKIAPPSLRQSVVDLKNRLYGGYARHHYSQFGEDVVVASLVGPTGGFYVDVGAHHPFRYSNTALLYENGWRGINIEPNSGVVRLFRRHRLRDINIQSAVGAHPGNMTFYRFSDPAVNTFSSDMAKEMRSKPWLKELPSEQVRVRTLADILSEHLPENTMIDFLNVDVEGFDFDVLMSNEWERFHPRVIAVEDHHFDPKQPLESKVTRFLYEKGYSLVIRMGPTSIFRGGSARK